MVEYTIHDIHCVYAHYNIHVHVHVGGSLGTCVQLA